MTPWDLWMSALSRMPLSGDVTQAIAPLTNWFSPTVEMNFAGNRKIEGDVVANVASYGKQLGLLTDAVLALGKGNEAPPVQELRKLAAQIEERKRRHKDDLQQQARSALETLRKADPDALKRLLADFKASGGKSAA
jgi:hypothetical protein